MSEKEKESFFKTETTSGVFIPDPKDYDLTNEDDIKSCGLDAASFEKRNKEMFNNLVVDSKKENPVATVCMAFEKSFSKRELAFLLGKETLMLAYKDSLKQK